MDAAWDQAFGQRLALARTNVGVTQAQVGEHLGVSRSSIANMESGRQTICARHVALASVVLRVDARWLLFGDGPGVVPPSPIPPREVLHSVAVLNQITAQVSVVADFLTALTDLPTSPEVDTQ